VTWVVEPPVEVYFLLALRKPPKGTPPEALEAHDADAKATARALETALSERMAPDEAVVWPSGAWWVEGGGPSVGYVVWINDTTSTFDHLIVMADEQYPTLGKGTAELVEVFLRDHRDVWALRESEEGAKSLTRITGLRRCGDVVRDEQFFKWADAVEERA
jgi:hypothetical protein